MRGLGLSGLKSPRIDLREITRKQGATSTSDRSIDFASDAIRIGVPHQLIVHNIFDNIVNCAKTTKQLNYRWQTGTDDYILEKHPEGPRSVPKISVRAHVFLFEIEDGAFEWKLGTIYRTGLLEQKQRLAREEAFRIKCRRLQKDAARRQGTGNTVTDQSGRGRSEFKEDWTIGDRTQSPTPLSRQQSPARPNDIFDAMRYDPDASVGLTGATNTSIRDARERLDMHNAQSWKKRIDGMLQGQTAAIQDLRSLLWGAFEAQGDETRHNENILQMPRRPALMSVLMSDLHMGIDKPSFPMEQLPGFMYRVGKGLPKDTEFTMLIPLNVRIDMGETRMSLRDYPLPLLHIPSLRPGQSPRLPSWSLRTDFVIGEEFSDYKSSRDLAIKVIPAEKMGKERSTWWVRSGRTANRCASKNVLRYLR